MTPMSRYAVLFEQPTPISSPSAAPRRRRTQAGRRTYPATNQLVNQSISQSTGQSTEQAASRIVDRPKAFYITKRVDKYLDDAVRYFQERHKVKKVDRSAIVNALLDNETNWTVESLDLLFSRVINQLTNRLTG